MQQVDFFRLDRPIQERFVAAAQATAPPMPLAVRHEPVPLAVRAWLIASAFSLGLLAFLWSVGYGKLASGFALQPAGMLVVYVLLAAFAGAALVIALHIQRAQRRLPFARAIFLFPSGVIDARQPQFRVQDFSTLVSATSRGSVLVLNFPNGVRYEFTTPNPERAAELTRTIGELKSQLTNDAAPTTARTRAALDPLSDTGFRNPFSPRESMPPPRPRVVHGVSSLAAGLVVGALFGFGVFKMRNYLGEAALYRAARTENTLAGYREYVERGGSNADVREVLLPRAELAELTKRHDLPELERFAREHKGSRIQPEIDAVLHQELLVALDQAKRADSLTALKQFRERFQEHASIMPELEQAVSARLTAALRDFDQRARPNPEVAELFRHLLNYTAHHDGKVELRFRRRLADSVAKAEALLEKSHYFGGKDSLPGQYFDATHAAAREAAAGKEILATLAQAFPEDIVHFELGPVLDDTSEEDPKMSVPTILITHRTEMSGAYLMRKPKAALTGVGILFRAAFLLPDDPTTFAFKYSSWNAPDMRSMMNGESFETIYDDMGDKAFARLPRKYLTELVPGLVPKATTQNP